MEKTSIKYYKSGIIQAKGKLKDRKKSGYWKWYRNDGSKLKTGYFQEGKLTKDWMKYDKNGKLLKEK